MADSPDYLLERFVHRVLGESSSGTCELVDEALEKQIDGRRILSEILWPAAECVQQLHHGGQVSRRIFNRATRSLFISAGQVRLPAAPGEFTTDRSVFVCGAPGEMSDLGSHLVALLAESYGFSTMFAGARLSAEEVMFAISRLKPDVALVQGSLGGSRGELNRWMERIRQARFWPEVQLAAVGAVAAFPEGAEALQAIGAGTYCTADVISRHPVEILELLALFPSYRAQGGRLPARRAPLHMVKGATPLPDPTEAKQSILQHFPGRFRWN